MNDDGSWILVMIALAITGIGQEIQRHLKFKRWEREKKAYYTRIMEKMRDPKWQESMRGIMASTRPNSE